MNDCQDYLTIRVQSNRVNKYFTIHNDYPNVMLIILLLHFTFTPKSMSDAGAS